MTMTTSPTGVLPSGTDTSCAARDGKGAWPSNHDAAPTATPATPTAPHPEDALAAPSGTPAAPDGHPDPGWRIRTEIIVAAHAEKGDVLPGAMIGT
jgi:hypothetical protein